MIHAPARQRNLASFDEAGLKVDKHGASFVQNDGLGLSEFVEFWHDLQDSVGAALHHVQEVLLLDEAVVHLKSQICLNNI